MRACQMLGETYSSFPAKYTNPVFYYMNGKERLSKYKPYMAEYVIFANIIIH